MGAAELIEDRERRSRTVSHGGEQLYAEATGHGPAVVLCHGLGGNHAIWWRQIDPFAGDHTVITWDQRGFGNSTAATGEAGIEPAVDDLGAVLDAFGVDRAHLIGQSMGAFVALRFALRYPGRTRSLVLSTTLAAADPALARGLLAAVPRRPLRDRHAVLSERFAESNPDLAVLYNQISSFGTKPPVAAMLESMAGQTFSDEELGSVTCPVLCLAAEQDHLCPPDAMKAVAARLPTARFAVLPDTGHSAYYETPAAWNSTVLEFLAIA